MQVVRKDSRLCVGGGHGMGVEASGGHVYSVRKLRIMCLEGSAKSLGGRESLIGKAAERYVSLWRAGEISLSTLVLASSLRGGVAVAAHEALCRIQAGAQ